VNVKELFDSSDSLEGRPSLGEEAADKLRAMILTERYPPGGQLPEIEVAGALGISRTPLRDALKILVADGLVVHRGTRRTFYVADPTLEELADDLAVIGALEGLAGELACERATDDELQTIADQNDRMAAASNPLDPLALFNVDMAFHQAIVEAARNPSLERTHRQYNARLWRARFVSSKRTSRRNNQRRMHQRITDALLKRDGSRAAEALRQHMENAVDNIRVALEERRAKNVHDL
jgi:DNA-binding GntR family transcriptional regulator